MKHCHFCCELQVHVPHCPVSPLKCALCFAGSGFGANASAVNVTVGTASAQVTGVQPTSLTFIVPAKADQSADGSVTLTVRVNGQNASTEVPYSAANTPIVSSVEPLLVPAAAASQITLLGTGFSGNATQVGLHAPCAWWHGC